VASQSTLIDSAEILELTADKIKAGTIGAHTITMDGNNSIIKSSNFDGVSNNDGTYSGATSGWLINGSGKSYFYNTTIVGSIDIGGFDSGSFHVDSEGNLWMGGATFNTSTFRVAKEGDVFANSLSLNGNTSVQNAGKLYISTVTPGVYNNTNTAFYADGSGKFSLGDKLTWDGSALTIQGTLKFPDGTTPGTFDDGDAITSGSVAGLTINSSKIFFGTGTYGNTSTAFYVDNTGKFSLGDKLTWDGSALTIQGTLKFPDGSTPVSEEEAEEAAEDVITSGFVGGLIIQSDKMYYGAGSFASSNTGFYVANNGGATNFSLGDKLTWNGSTLSISGNVVITGGSTLASINNAQDTADTANNTANNAQNTANNAQNTANNAQDDANSAYNLASTKITAGEVVTTINGGSTTIHGDKITTGTLSADRISGGTITATIQINSPFINGGSISIGPNGNFQVDSSRYDVW